MKIVIFLLFLFLFDSHSLAAPPPDTPAFSIFVDQLSIVARISNAIAIQTELITNSTDIEAVMKELIPGHSGFLPLVRQVNVSQAIKILDWLTEEIIAVKTVVNKITKDRLQECLKVINFLTENVGILEDLKEYKELTAEKFYSAVQDLNATKPFKLCSKEVLEQVSAFYELNYYKRQEHGHNILNLFHNLSQIQHTLDYGKCISNLQSFHDRLEKLPLYTSFTNLPKIKKVKNVEQVFEQKFNKFSLLGNSSEIVQKSMGEMKGIWSKLPLEFDSNGIDHIITFYSQHWYYANLGRMRKTMTSGFFLPMDTIQVKEDLKSSFFKNRIAQKKSVSGLTKALNFYLKFAAESAKLEKAFAESVHFITNQIPIIERMNKTIEALIYFDSKDILKRLEDLTRDTKECTEKLVISLQDFSEFEQAHNYATKIFNNMRRLRNLSIAANKDVVSEKYEQLLKDFQKVESELDEEKVVHWLTEYQKSFDFPFAMDVSKLLVEFKDAFETLENDIKEFQKSKLNNKSFLVKNQINSSSLFTFLECYKSKMVSLDLFKQSALFLLNSTNILDDAMVNATRSFFIHLKNIQEAQNTVYVMEKEKADFPESRVLLDFKNSLDLSESFGKGVMALREIRDVVKNQTLLLDLDKLSKTSMVLIKSAARKPTQEFFLSRKGDIQNFQKSLFALEEAAILSVDTNLTNTKPVFKAAQKVIGFNITKFEITEAAMLLELSHEREDSKRLKDLSQLHLDFASSRHFLDGATISAKLLNDQFEHFLGFREEKSKTVIIKELPTVLIIVFIGVILLSVCACLVGYGFTKNGRAKCKNYWLQYFGKPQDFEKRWRYALFMDTVEDKNVVIDCAREVNPVNLKKVLTRGAYVNVYSRYGNTALHTATQRGYSEIVRILITHGADRSLLNYQNKTAEQMLPKESDYKKMDKKVAKRFRETAQLYKKLRMKKYRIRVPREFPVSSYHIYMEDRTDDDLTDAFMDKFQHITSDEALPTTTHCICHTTADGVLETDNFEVLYWVFHGAIIVQERWMTDCLKNPKLIEKDENYLVQHVKYNSVMYRNSVLPWTRAMAKGTMPYLQGVYILMVMQKCSYLTSLTNIIPKLGAVLLTTMPSLETFNKGAHPYLHARNNPVWILHDNTLDLSAFKDDPNHLFTIISEQEFIALLLRRDIDQNKNKDPVPAVTMEATCESMEALSNSLFLRCTLIYSLFFSLLALPMIFYASYTLACSRISKLFHINVIIIFQMHLFGFALHCFSRIVLHSLDLYNYAFVAYCEMTPNIWRCFVFRLLYVTGLWMVCASTAPLVIERFVATLKASSYEHHGCALGMAMVVLQFSLAATPTLTTFLNFNLNESRSYCLAVKPGVVSNSERIYATNFAVQIIARIAFHYLFKINKNLRKEQMTTSLSNRYSLEQNLKSVRMLKMFANLQSIFMIIHTTSFLLLIQFGTQIAKSTYFSLVELNAQYPLYAIVSISFLLKEMHVNRVKLRKKLEVHVLTDQAVYFENFKKVFELK